MIISEKLKERFCKDCKLPIALFKEPYFTERLELLDPYYATLEKWGTFVRELQRYDNEQDYFEEYNRIKDDAIDFIKNTKGYQQFNNEDMNQYRIAHEGLPGKDIFKPTNDGRMFLSIDMAKANFSSLRRYNRHIFDNAKTWEEFLSGFTSNEHIINSKYIRQVILGNCNPKRHITYEKYLMEKILCQLAEVTSLDNCVFFSNDEIVLDITDMPQEEVERVIQRAVLCENISGIEVPLKVEIFQLKQINGTNGYAKCNIENQNEILEFKCLDANTVPFVIRALNGEQVQDNDRVFVYEGKLAYFIDVPKISIDLTSEQEKTEELEY